MSAALWLVLGAMTVLAGALLAWPLLRPPRQRSGRREHELQVYRAQLDEVAREHERGLLGEREAAAARLEVERRMLAADAARDRPANAGDSRRPLAALGLLVIFAVVSVALYGRLGSPELPSVPFAGRVETPRQGADPATPAAVETMIEGLEQRVAQSPDLEGWARLGQAYELAGRFDDAVRAYREAVALDDGSARLHAALGEALVMTNDGIVGPAANAAFARALALDADEPRARFYRGLALAQEGDRQGAFDAWAELIAGSPAAAPWRPEVQRRVAAQAVDLGLDPAAIPPPAPPSATPPGPSAEQMQAAEAMPAGDRAAMIRDMVDGLATRLQDQPDDIEGWRRLGRSYQVLGELEQSADAYQRVALALPDDLTAQLDYADALLAALPADQPDDRLPAVLTEQMGRVLALDPQNPAALFYLGQAAAQAGDAAGARDHWQRLLARIPLDAPERTQVQRLIDGLPDG
jgi:cytochrome c-type biogenesis protein CcmH